MGKRGIAIILLTACLMLNGCSGGENGEKAPMAISVETQKMQKDSINSYVKMSGKIAAKNEVLVIPKISGKVTRLPFDIGDNVKAGDIILGIDDKDIRPQYEQAEAALTAAQASYDRTVGSAAKQQDLQLKSALTSAQINLETAKLANERTAALYAAGAVSKQQAEAAHDQYTMAQEQYNIAKENSDIYYASGKADNEKMAKASLAQAQAAFDTVNSQMENTIIRAEISGVIGMRNASIGNMVSPGTPVISVVDPSGLFIELSVSDNVVRRLSKGTKVEVEIGALGSEPVEGTVTAVAPAADKMTLLYPVKISIGNKKGILKSGMFASVNILLESSNDTFSVPINTVCEDDGGSYVFVVEDNKAVKKYVTTGLFNDTHIEIKEGISEGETVVVKGQSFLSDGSSVAVVEKE